MCAYTSLKCVFFIVVLVLSFSAVTADVRKAVPQNYDLSSGRVDSLYQALSMSQNDRINLDVVSYVPSDSKSISSLKRRIGGSRSLRGRSAMEKSLWLQNQCKQRITLGMPSGILHPLERERQLRMINWGMNHCK